MTVVRSGRAVATDNTETRWSERIYRLLQLEFGGLFTHSIFRRIANDGASLRSDQLARILLTAQSVSELDYVGRKWRIPLARPVENEPGSSSQERLRRTTLESRPSLSVTRFLHAIRAEVLSGSLKSDDDVGASALVDGTVPSGWQLFDRLLPHYAECLRLGGATRLGHFADKHTVQFHLLDVRARWWPDDAGTRPIRVARDELGGAFLQSLSRRISDPILLGYPVSVAQLPEGDALIHPVTLLQCRWQLDDVALTLWPNSPTPILNPEWTGKRSQRRDFKATLKRLNAITVSTDEDLSNGIGDFWHDIPDMARTLGTFLSTMISDRLDPGSVRSRLDLAEVDTIQNVLGLFLISENNYTAGSRSDLIALQGVGKSELSKSALASFFDVAKEATEPCNVVSPLLLSEDQFIATQRALSDPLTVISGPPGTGKSQVVAAIMTSAAMAGRSVLFSSHTHKALDAVQQRLVALSPDRQLLARAVSDSSGVSFDFKSALDALIARLKDTNARESLGFALRDVQFVNQRTSALLEKSDELTKCADELARLWVERDRRELDRTRQQGAEQSGSRSPITNLIEAAQAWIERLFGWFGYRPATKSERNIGDAALDRAISEVERRHRAFSRAFEAVVSESSLPQLLDTLAKSSMAAIPALINALDASEIGERTRLTTLLGNVGLARSKEERMAVWQNNSDLVLRHFPLWSSTVLSVPNRIPLTTAMFDYVIIDEATTCNIAQAIPLLARGRHAIIVGDKMQTGMVSDLDATREREMLTRANLTHESIGRYSFSQVSLFDLASSVPGARHHLLRDHFRCASQIAGFISDSFYGGQLYARTDETSLRPPRNFKIGMHWTDIIGPIEPAGNGSRSMSEAQAIADHLRTLLVDQNYQGSVGVVTPFQRQAELIRRLVEQKISPAKIEASNLVVGTSHAFQGDDRDIVLVSLCFGPGMPRGSQWFLSKSHDWLNVAVSRARAVCHIFGNRKAAEFGSVAHIKRLARWLSSSDSEQENAVVFESPWERRLYEALVDRGVTPITQYRLAGKRLDLAVRNERVRLDIEVDGETYHRDRDGFRKSSDHWRDHIIQSLGWRVRRFWVYELKEDMGGCVERILRDLDGKK